MQIHFTPKSNRNISDDLQIPHQQNSYKINKIGYGLVEFPLTNLALHNCVLSQFWECFITIKENLSNAVY